MIKSAFGADQTLLVRSLNSMRQNYFPTYIGLRLIGHRLPLEHNQYLTNLLERRLKSGDTWRFTKFELYKGSQYLDNGMQHVYRDCLAPSPLTALAESMVLGLLAESQSFSVPSRVYSYHWPASRHSGSSYKYFVEGYIKRNVEIADALNQPGYVAVVTDIKSFYPSAKRERLEQTLSGKLDSKELEPWRDSVKGFFSQLLDAGGQGIPIGPATGHVLGHLALGKFDNELESRYGKSYFRYVDDVVIACHSSEVDSVENYVKLSVERHGFSLNIEKTEVIDRSTWQSHVLRSDVNEDDSFRSYSSDLTVYLAFHPDRAEDLKKALKDNGLSIPVRRLLALSSYSRFRYFLERRRTRSGLSHAAGLFFASNQQFVERGLRIKRAHEDSLTIHLSAPVEQSPGTRRWQVQRIRRIVNALFYLRNFDEWKRSDSVFYAAPELVEQRALASALSSGSVNPILPFYGRGPSAFAELWAEHGTSQASLDSNGSGYNQAEIDSLVTLKLYGMLPSQTLSGIQGKGNMRLLAAMNQSTVSSRSQPDLSFEDELESLRLGVSDTKLAELAQTRYALSEGTALEALSLLSSEYRS